MRCTLLAASLTFAFFAGLVQAQSVAADDPAHKPSVFLGGEKEKKNKTVTSRGIKGVVIDAGGQPIQGALVTLSDMKSKETWTFVTKADGKYHFDELSLVVDYEVIARKAAEASTIKKLSQYDHSPEVTRNLELQKAAAAASSTAPAAAAAKEATPAPKN